MGRSCTDHATIRLRRIPGTASSVGGPRSNPGPSLFVPFVQMTLLQRAPAHPMVNRPLTSPPYGNEGTCAAAPGGAIASARNVHDHSRTRACRLAIPDTRSPFARLNELARRRDARQAADRGFGRRAAASGAAFCRAGAGRFDRRIWPLSDQQGDRRFPRRCRRMARTPLRVAARGRSGQRGAGAQRHPRGPVPRRRRGKPLRRAAARPAGRS